MPQGDDAPHFRSLLNELQMLLFEHPVNQAREARGELPVNSLWLWGGGQQAFCPKDAGLSVYTRDDEVSALAAFCGAAVHPLPAQPDKTLLKTEAIVVLDELTRAGQCGDAFGWRESIRSLEANWFVPLLDAIGSIGPQGLHLVDPVNGKALHVTANRRLENLATPAKLEFSAGLDTGYGLNVALLYSLNSDWRGPQIVLVRFVNTNLETRSWRQIEHPFKVDHAIDFRRIGMAACQRADFIFLVDDHLDLPANLGLKLG